jgi:hypothetical protein
MCDETSGFDTKCLHGGWSGDPTTGAKGVPVYRTVRAPSSEPSPPLASSSTAGAEAVPRGCQLPRSRAAPCPLSTHLDTHRASKPHSNRLSTGGTRQVVATVC